MGKEAGTLGPWPPALFPGTQMADGEREVPRRLDTSEQCVPECKTSPSLLQKGGRAHPGVKDKTPRIWELFAHPLHFSAVCPGASHTTSSCVNMDINSTNSTLCGEGEKRSPQSALQCLALKKCMEIVVTILYYYYH